MLPRCESVSGQTVHSDTSSLVLEGSSVGGGAGAGGVWVQDRSQGQGSDPCPKSKR